MRTLRCSALPGLPAAGAPYEFHLFESDLRLEIPADHRGPDVAIALRPEQEAWIGRRRDLTQTWDCRWTFADRAALDRFLAELGATDPGGATDPRAATEVAASVALSVAPTPTSPPSQEALAAPPGTAPAVRSPGDGCVLGGGQAGNRVEVARAGDVVVSVGLCDGWPRPWDVVARRGSGPGALDELVAYWRRSFPTILPAAPARALSLAEQLRGHDRLWVTYRQRGIDGAERCRLLELDDRVALETLGKKRKLSVFATLEDALAKVGPEDIACGLAAPTGAEREAIAALGLPAAKRARRPKALPEGATLARRLGESFRRLTAASVLARERVPGPRSHAWQLAGSARERGHVGAVFYLADHWKRREDAKVLHLYWVSWDPAAPPLAFARRVVGVLEASGLACEAPAAESDAIVVRVR